MNYVFNRKLKQSFNCIFFILFSFLSSFSIAQSISEVEPSYLGFSKERLANIDQMYNNYIREDKIAGAVVLIARKGNIAYHEAFGMSNIEESVVMEKSSIFRIASQTKALVSVGIMILQEEGKLLITDAVAKYIPEFEETYVAVQNDSSGYSVEKANRKITIRDLLSHTSGIDYGGRLAKEEWKNAGIQGWYFADRNESMLPIVKRMAKLPMEAHPGEKFVYGYSTDILGALIEVISNQSLSDFIHDRLLDPLEMRDTHFYLPAEKANRLTTVYSADETGLNRAPDEGGMHSQGEYLREDGVCFSGGAGLLSTASDYANFIQMLLDEGIFKSNRILSPKSVELMRINHLGKNVFPWEPGTGFGLGFAVVTDLAERQELGSEGMYGWGGAYHSVYWIDPEEELIFLSLSQLIPANNLDDHQKLKALVYQALDD